MSNMRERLEILKKWMNSPEGEAAMAKEREENRIKSEIRDGRYRKFEKYIETNSFDDLMLRLKEEHSDDYVGKCYKKGYQPYPNHKLGFILGYVSDNFEPVYISQLDCEFSNTCYIFKGYVFQTICGQGCFDIIYKQGNYEERFLTI